MSYETERRRTHGQQTNIVYCRRDSNFWCKASCSLTSQITKLAIARDSGARLHQCVAKLDRRIDVAVPYSADTLRS